MHNTSTDRPFVFEVKNKSQKVVDYTSAYNRWVDISMKYSEYTE